MLILPVCVAGLVRHLLSFPPNHAHIIVDGARSYLNGSGAPIPPLSMFNSAGRAYPDVAALGINYQVFQSLFVV